MGNQRVSDLAMPERSLKASTLSCRVTDLTARYHIPKTPPCVIDKRIDSVTFSNRFRKTNVSELYPPPRTNTELLNRLTFVMQNETSFNVLYYPHVYTRLSMHTHTRVSGAYNSNVDVGQTTPTYRLTAAFKISQGPFAASFPKSGESKRASGKRQHARQVDRLAAAEAPRPPRSRDPPRAAQGPRAGPDGATETRMIGGAKTGVFGGADPQFGGGG